ncbi:MAG: hypothetical protein JWL90_4304 [Chthoniobacteraceae bacterium]|nr:hypothetical protein [Chthoniobacteraceae bacterium]
MIEAEQFEFSFQQTASDSAQTASWRAQWDRRAAELCGRFGLPLNCRVEARLYRGTVLKGELSVVEDQLFFEDQNQLMLMIGRRILRFCEIASVMQVN